MLRLSITGLLLPEKADAGAEFPARQFSATSGLCVEGQRPSRWVQPAGMLVVQTDSWEGTMKLPPPAISAFGRERCHAADAVSLRVGVEEFCGNPEGAAP